MIYNKTLKIKSILLVLLSFLSMTAFAQVKKVAILETVDKNGDVPYAIKLMIRSNLAKVITNTPGYEGYDRTDMKQISNEQTFQRTGMVSDEDIKKLGKITGAQYILVAEAANVDKQNIFITAKILNVETAKMEATDNALTSTLPSDIQHGCEVLANKLLGISPPQSSVASAISTSPTQQVQSLPQSQPVTQDFSPSSFPLKKFPDGTKGIVFYTDQNGHGLAVSLDEESLKWEDAKNARACHDIIKLPNDEGQSELTYGLGQQNTDAIIQQISESYASAASWCKLHGNGWYLPSAGELWYLMKIANNDKFEGQLNNAIIEAEGVPIDLNFNTWYWSSSEKSYDEAINVNPIGWVTGGRKTSKIRVRAVRAF